MEPVYKVTKEWTEDCLIPAWDVELDRQVFLESFVWVQNPNNVPGLYKKSCPDFKLGEEGGSRVHKWWCIGSPRVGRFEYTVTVDTKLMLATFHILQNFFVRVHIWNISEVDGPTFFWKGKLFSEENLMLELYLENKHDYSDSDMVYAVGKRKYSNELIQLIPNGQQSDRED